MRARENAKPSLLKRALACLLSAAMCIAFTPAVAWSGTQSITVGDLTISTTNGSGLVQDTDYTYSGNTLTIKSDKAITISGTTTTDHIVVPSGVTANITLSGVSIQFNDGGVGPDGPCAFAIYSGATVNLTLAGENILKSGFNTAGLQVLDGSMLTITSAGTGSLTATGGSFCAGIGGIHAGGTIAIYGGNITATGGTGAAGIGGGLTAKGGTIAIYGGNITATGGTGGVSVSRYGGGAGIGGGANGNGGTITISGGTVTAKGSDGGAGIGGGGNSPGTEANPYGTFFNTGTDGNAVIFASSISDTSGKTSTSNPWSGVIFEGNDGQVYGSDFTLSESFTIPAGKTLKIDMNKVLTIPSGKTLSIADKGSNESSGKLSIEHDSTLIVMDGGTLDNAGTITIANGTLRNHGAITNDINGTITNSKELYNYGTITNNGSLSITDGGKLNNAGTITSERATSGSSATEGGGVHVAQGGTLNMTGGSIENCSATNGGGVYVAGGTFEMSGGSIENCSATNGGGVYVASGGTFTMSGGIIENCTAQQGGGVYNFGTTTLSGSSKISGCKATSGQGGGVLSSGASLAASDVEITDCTASDMYSGALCAYADVSNTFQIDGGTFGGSVQLISNGAGSDTVSGGTFNGQVNNLGTIGGGTFNGQVKNYGTISDGTFNGTVTNRGTISGGTFNGQVDNNGTISGGTFKGKVTNKAGDEYTNAGEIYGGAFYGEVVNKDAAPETGFPAGEIYGGTFYGGLEGYATTDGYCTVTYKRESGVIYAKQIVPSGGNATHPGNPTRDGYTFDGWYMDQTYSEDSKFDFSAQIASSIPLYAKWIPGSYTVKFDTVGGTEIADKTIANGEGKVLDGITDPPMKTGYTFSGWKCGRVDVTADTTYAQLVANETVESITLTAQWKVNQYTITFDTDGGSEVKPVTANYGVEITAPDNPTKSGYRFVGWYKDPDCTNAWDFGTDTVPASNITLYAKWQYVPPATPQASADCIKAIDALPDVEAVTLESGEAIQAARSAYDALTAYQKSFVAASKVSKLEAVEARYSDLVALAPVEAAIDALPDVDGVTLESGEAILAARDAHDALSDYHKTLVPADALAKLEAVEARYGDVVVVAPVEDALDALPQAEKLKAKDAKAAAKAAVAALAQVAGLTEAQQTLVDAELAANAEAVVAQAAVLVAEADAKAAGKVKDKKLAVKSGKSKSITFNTKLSAAGTKVVYKKASGSKYVTVSKSGKVTAKKGMKKGKTYKAKVKVTCGNTTRYVKVVVSAR